MNKKYDIIIIGSGPGGEGAAMRAAKAGKRVAVVEEYRLVGGACTHWATIPSKALRQVINLLNDFRSHPLFRPALGTLDISYADLLKSAVPVIEQQTAMRANFYERNHVTVIRGRASFLDEHTVAVKSDDGQVEELLADNFVIATGSHPYRPADVDFTHPRVRDSDTILRMEETPRSITIYGAGVAGCEYATIFRNLGVKVNLINTRDKLLAFLDDEIIDALSYHLREQGILIRHNEEYERVEPRDDGVVVHLKSGKQVKTDILLWANGRSGNTEQMGLESVGIETDHRGNIKVDEHYCTSRANIRAVGDVVGFPSLAGASYDQGRFAATHICEGKCDRRLVEDMPVGIFTSPEISSLGKTERELTAEKTPYEVGHSQFRSLARAQIDGHTVGMLKILFHRDTLRILGIHCFGHKAAEIIHIGQAIMSQKGEANTLQYFIDTTFNYPTMAEAYRVAALNGLNRIF